MTKAHKHAHNMALYAQDAAETERPWERWEARSADGKLWVGIGAHPYWGEDIEYRRKPRTIDINGYEVPEPVREAPKQNTRVHAASPSSPGLVVSGDWDCSALYRVLLCRGLIHLTQDAAKAHARALLSFTGAGDE